MALSTNSIFWSFSLIIAYSCQALSDVIVRPPGHPPPTHGKHPVTCTLAASKSQLCCAITTSTSDDEESDEEDEPLSEADPFVSTDRSSSDGSSFLCIGPKSVNSNSQKGVDCGCSETPCSSIDCSAHPKKKL